MGKKEKALPNEFKKYWHPPERDWHERIIGVYHISMIGCSHQDLDYDEHSGPCLRQTYWEYTNPIPNTDETDGNFEMGKDIHKKLQKKIKKWKPNTNIEEAVAKIFEKDRDKLNLVGSADVRYKHLFNLERDTPKTKKKSSIWDIKSASDYTMPKGKYDKNPTHFDQGDLYGAMLMLYELHPKHNEIVRVKIIYVDKHNKKTCVQRSKFRFSEAVDKLADCVDRAFYLHRCLKTSQVPVPEPMKWCKYCKYLRRCMEQGDVEPIMKGKKKPKLDGLKVE